MIFRAMLILCAVMLTSLLCRAQDGCDIHYIKSDSLDSSYLGKFVHFDFGNRSFWRSTVRDKVTVKIDEKEIVFIEHRVDDGYNNWFDQQYLESVNQVDGFSLRLVKNKLLEVKNDSFKVESYFDFYDSKKNIVPNKSFSKALEFKKSDIAEVLVYVR